MVARVVGRERPGLGRHESREGQDRVDSLAMPERGGPTTQSGIFYQNSIAALYVGRLCDPRERPRRDQVTRVRVEAPEEVDDIVVTYADGHTDWIQAKEKLEASGEVWEKHWQAFERQRWTAEFSDRDGLVLVTGAVDGVYLELREIAGRADGSPDAEEWRHRLNKSHVALIERIRPCLSPSRRDDAALHALLSRLRVEISPLEQIERDQTPLWMPASSADKHVLFSLLRDKAGGRARYRKTFLAPELRSELKEHDGIGIVEAIEGVTSYRSTIERQFSRIEVPGTALSGNIAELFLWPKLRSMDLVKRRILFEEDDLLEEAGEDADLRTFPERCGSRAVIVAAAGFGKSVLLHALAYHRARSAWLPAHVPLVELAESKLPVLDFLLEHVNRRLAVDVPWLHYCENGSALLLFDGLDELDQAARTRVLDRIKEFSSRFSEVPWLLTVRDAGALNAPLNPPILTLEVLDQEGISAMCEAYLKAARSGLRGREVGDKLALSPELSRLARIPLFLTLLLSQAIQHPSDPLPRRRSDLLEGYIETVFDTESRRPPLSLHTTRDDLREAAERLAFAILDKATIDIPERDARKVLRVTGQADPEIVVNDLVACGLVRRSEHRLSFAFPILQEYLAGCYLAERHPEQVLSRFEGAISRPWAQALQFSLERHSSPDEVIRELLEREDDAFSTMLRAVGRCIANGAKVSSETRKAVGDRLLVVWASDEGKIGEQAGHLIANGFASPLPDQARRNLEEGRGLQHGGAEMIVAARDDELTRIILRWILDPKRDISHHYHLHGWQPAVDRIASEALGYFVTRARSPRTRGEEADALAHLIRDLSPERIAESARAEFVADEGLPDPVRLAVHLLGQSTLPESCAEMVDRIFRAPAPGEGRLPHGFFTAQDSLWRLPLPGSRWRLYVSDDSIHADRRRWLLSGISEFRVREDALREVQSLQVDSSEQMARAVLMMRANLHDRGAMEQLLTQFASMPADDLCVCVELLSKYRAGDVIERGLRCLAHGRTDVDGRLSAAHALSAVMRYEVELSGLSGGATLGPTSWHPAASEVARVIWEWSKEAEELSLIRMRLLTAAAEMRHPAAMSPLRRELDSWLDRLPSCTFVSEIERFDHENSIEAALRVLAASELRLSPAKLKAWAMRGSYNLCNEAIRLLSVNDSGDEALSCLLELYHVIMDRYLKGLLLERSERLAQRLGVRIVRDDDGHLVRSGPLPHRPGADRQAR
ncbi:hypothetical protein predicted by Glimmer/Critica [Sorangium cellulosum So ce56]|uniref:NACHT domain-containing protein n=2 Tax=Sorangium cellulosum TaxID=56 RepID=A9G4R3_SORC5|nr:hypothetical protein predicted by Glimmer/Critica [Sorangium cellulosum So ce56]